MRNVPSNSQYYVSVVSCAGNQHTRHVEEFQLDPGTAIIDLTSATDRGVHVQLLLQ